MLMWGGNAIAGKLAIGHVSPMMLTCWRWVLATIILVVLARAQLRQDWPVIRRNALYLFLLGACGFAVFNAFLYSALKYTTAINVTIIQAAMPMIIFVLNFVVFRTPLHWAQIIGYTTTLVGVAMVATNGNLTQLAQTVLNHGDAIMLVATLIYAAYSVALRARPAMHWISFLTVLIASAAIASLGLAAVEVGLGQAQWPVTPTAWAVIAYATIFPSILGQGFFARGVELIGPNRAGLFLNLVPIFGAILAVIILGEDFRWFHAVALCLVCGGIVLAQQLSPTK